MDLNPLKADSWLASDVVNNHSIFSGCLSKHFDNKKLSDIILIVNEKKFNLHKILLEQSDVFSAMFNSSWSESGKQEVTLTEEDICVPHMEQFLGYFYGVDVKLNHDNVVPLAALANKYALNDLETHCEQFLHQNLSGVSFKKVIELMRLTDSYNLDSLNAKCKRILALNMFYFCPYEDNKASCMLTGTELKELLSHDYIVCNPLLFITNVIQWAKQLEENESTVDACDEFDEGEDEGKCNKSVTLSINSRPHLLVQVFDHLDIRLLDVKDIAKLEHEIQAGMKLNNSALIVLQKLIIEAYQHHAHTFDERVKLGLRNMHILDLQHDLNNYSAINKTDLESYRYAAFYIEKISGKAISVVKNLMIYDSSSNADTTDEKKEQLWKISVNGKLPALSIRATFNAALKGTRIIKMIVLFIADLKFPKRIVEAIHTQMITDSPASMQIKLQKEFVDNDRSTMMLRRGTADSKPHLYFRVYIRHEPLSLVADDKATSAVL